jgi:hypothetical protein
MHQSDLAHNDAIQSIDRLSAEKSICENIAGVMKLHGEDKLLPYCCSADDPPLQSLNRFITSSPQQERASSSTLRADTSARRTRQEP